MGVIWQGRELAGNQCKIKKEIIDGIEKEILYDIPKSWKKLRYTDDAKQAAEKKKIIMSAEREQLLNAILTDLQNFSDGANVFKTDKGKFTSEVVTDKWFTIGIIENKKVPSVTFWKDPKGKTLRDKLISSLTETLALFGEVKKGVDGYCVFSNNKWFTLSIIENRTEPTNKAEYTAFIE